MWEVIGGSLGRTLFCCQGAAGLAGDRGSDPADGAAPGGTGAGTGAGGPG